MIYENFQSPGHTPRAIKSQSLGVGHRHAQCVKLPRRFQNTGKFGQHCLTLMGCYVFAFSYGQSGRRWGSEKKRIHTIQWEALACKVQAGAETGFCNHGLPPQREKQLHSACKGLWGEGGVRKEEISLHSGSAPCSVLVQ